jgi:hypothetical protein
MYRALGLIALVTTPSAYAMGGEWLLPDPRLLIQLPVLGLGAGALFMLFTHQTRRALLRTLLFSIVWIVFVVIPGFGSLGGRGGAIWLVALGLTPWVLFVAMLLNLAMALRSNSESPDSLSQIEMKCPHCGRITSKEDPSCLWCHKPIGNTDTPSTSNA